ncbi:MAG TPA: hypothetical protein PK397_06680 [Ignavibacteriaceae bacterium]|nr:hypothetical protein [Ignavibacteriaceae bacterium]
MKKVLLIAVAFLLICGGCGVYKTFVNLSRLQFKLSGVSSISVAGVNVQGKNKLQDFSAGEVLTLTSAVSKGSLPLSVTLNVEAKNPNDGSGGYPSTNATIKSFPYRFLVNDKQVVTGNINSAVTVPGTGQTSIIQLNIGFDLYQVVQNGSYNDLLNLALSIGGIGKGNSNVSLYAKPVVSTSIGDISYPQEIRIVEMQFSGN